MTTTKNTKRYTWSYYFDPKEQELSEVFKIMAERSDVGRLPANVSYKVLAINPNGPHYMLQSYYKHLYVEWFKDKEEQAVK